MSKKNYVITSAPFSDWNDKLVKITSLIPGMRFESSIKNIALDSSTRVVVLGPVCEHVPTNMASHLILTVKKSTSDILGNKCLFAEFMMKNFITLIPKTIYIRRNGLEYLDKQYLETNPGIKMIIKPDQGVAGQDIDVSYTLPTTTDTNIVVSEYIKHEELYAGHLLVDHGKIIEQIYFKEHVGYDCIKRGRVTEYCTMTDKQMDCDCGVFEKVMKKLHYSGFVCIDFVIVDHKPIIFEINPRPGGSLIYDADQSLIFFQKIATVYDAKE